MMMMMHASRRLLPGPLLGAARAARRLNSQTAPESWATQFGSQKVQSAAEKEAKVGEVFRSVSKHYDLMNDLMSGGIHRIWKDAFIADLAPQPGLTHLDVAGGTGDISFRVVDAIRAAAAQAHPHSPTPSSTVICSDINPAMLEVGKQRAAVQGYSSVAGVELKWLEANAEKLPLETSSVDSYTISFGIRNCSHIDAVLAEAYRILRPGGRFLCLEFSHVTNPLLHVAYQQHLEHGIPLLGRVVAGDEASYRYLAESIQRFPAQAEFADMLKSAGFRGVSWTDLTFGIAAIHSGFKL
eukprot:TRINITY_DN15458_c0_g1_i1.p1 TRINITY_DN15458_c0_g1~~TRINITY_DN15458_c0_g1_i1.p1  ORF type:complete len:314 (+),score=55.98 TRINITY_DN15458_c0_g1_i1:53-943(+)